MIIIPAIDIKDGVVVRLRQGSYQDQKVYSDDPVAITKQWVSLGAKMLHIVDLDGAKEGYPKNIETVKKILANCSIPVQYGGGLRNRDSVKLMISLGVKRVVIGTKALDQSFLKMLIDEFREYLVIGLDVVDGKVKTNGWLNDSGFVLTSVCKQMNACGVKRIVCTDIRRDGTLQGPNFTMLEDVLKFAQFEVISSGGIGTLEDIKKMSQLSQKNLFGVIVGKALYERAFTLTEALTYESNDR
jgi:phosphoribosylformimino-5-aminoimidazole carboxamide ribotide isomerase